MAICYMFNIIKSLLQHTVVFIQLILGEAAADKKITEKGKRINFEQIWKVKKA